MQYTNLKYAVLVLAISSLALTACTPKTYPALIADSPTRLDDRPLCGLTLPEKDQHWRQIWRTESNTSGVRDLLRDGDWLWVATPVDVVRLDLRTLDCTRFGLSGTRRLLLDPDGRLWAAGGSELAHFDGQHWRSFSFGRDVGGSACDLALDKRGNLWVLSCSCRPGDGAWFRYPGHEPPEDGLWEGELVYNTPLDKVTDEARGGVWAGTDEGLVFSDGQSIKKYSLLPGDTVPVGPTVYDLVVDGSGRLWASTDGGLLFYDETSDTWQPSAIGERVLVSADYQGGLWAASSHYVGHFDGNAWSYYPFHRSWPCSPAVDILADAGGGLWLSSHHCTLLGFNGEVWDEYNSGSRGELLARGPGGDVYATGGRDIKRYDGTTWNRFPSIQVPRPTRVTAITIGPEGEVWVTSNPSPNLIVYRGNEWEEFPELVGKEITALLIGSQGDVWAGHSGGLLHYDGETWERIEREPPLSAINALAEDRQGRIWVGGRDGLSVYDPTKE